MMEQEIARAIEVLRVGGIIVYPTDTVWGVGCDATNQEAVGRVYQLKRSADKKSMIVLCDSVASVSRYTRNVPDVAWQLMELADKPLTLILPNGCNVAPNLIPEDGTLAVRVPDNDFCRKLIRRLGRPIVSTSANISGKPTPLTFDEISQEITGGADYVVDRSCEGSPTRKPSSIILLGEGGEIKIIRE